jgi:hypothetical protein
MIYKSEGPTLNQGDKPMAVYNLDYYDNEASVSDANYLTTNISHAVAMDEGWGEEWVAYRWHLDMYSYDESWTRRA